MLNEGCNVPDDDTTTFERSKGAILRHSNKVYNGLSAAAIVWMFATFTQDRHFQEHCRKCETFVGQVEFERERQVSKESAAALWRRSQDLDNKLDRLHVSKPVTNVLTAAAPP